MQANAWAIFICMVAAIMAIDLGLFSRQTKVVSARRAIAFTLVLVVLASLFSIPLYFLYENQVWGFGVLKRYVKGDEVVTVIKGMDAVWQFLAGYILELSLSADNVFVIAVIFRYFRIPRNYQHRVLFWGIMGALVMRGAMIGLGYAALKYLWFAMYVFGGLLIVTGYKLAFSRDAEFEPESNPVVRWARRMFRITNELDGEKFFTTMSVTTSTGAQQTIRAATPLFLALLVVETTDVIFAIDSIPAVYGVTIDPFIVFTSNIFAILGLRSLYFAIASLLTMLRFLKVSLGLLLVYIGVKMIMTQLFDWHPSPLASLGPIVAILSIGVIASAIAGPSPESMPPMMPGENNSSASIDLGDSPSSQ
jgi:tellurite resistance protein TerC